MAHNPIEMFAHLVVLVAGLYLVFGIARFNNACVETKTRDKRKSGGWPLV